MLLIILLLSVLLEDFVWLVISFKWVENENDLHLKKYSMEAYLVLKGTERHSDS